MFTKSERKPVGGTVVKTFEIELPVDNSAEKRVLKIIRFIFYVSKG